MEKKLLLVDDDLGMLDELSKALADKGISVTTADNGKEALEIAKTGTYGVAVVDIKLPDCNGLDLVHKLKEINPDSMYMLITAYASVESAIGAIHKNIFDYVIKPFNLDELIAAVNSAFEAMSSRDECIQQAENFSKEKNNFEKKARTFEWGYNLLLKRELKMAEMKNEINELLKRLGEKPKYGV